MAEPIDGLERRHVLRGVEGALEEASRPAEGAAFWMRRGAAARRRVLRLAPEIAVERGTVLGFDVGQPINTARGHETLMTPAPRASLRLGPDEWLLIGEGEQDGDGGGLKVTDISHRNVALEVGGSAAREVLNTGIARDLGGDAFPVGAATRGLFAKAEIVLVHCRGADGGSVYRVECWRSFTRYLAAHLAQSATLLGVGES